MKTLVIGLATALTLAAAGANAQTAAPAAQPLACKQQLTDLQKTWTTVMPMPPAKPAAAMVMGREGHMHTGIDYDYVNHQLRLANTACNAGSEHEAMLRMDVVRSIAKLAEVPHPASHNYPPKKG